MSVVLSEIKPVFLFLSREMALITDFLAGKLDKVNALGSSSPPFVAITRVIASVNMPAGEFKH